MRIIGWFRQQNPSPNKRGPRPKPKPYKKPKGRPLKDEDIRLLALIGVVDGERR
jgi:hypothetical protein